MKTRGELKAEARELLAGNWGKAIVLNIIPILGAVFAGVIITGAIALITYLVQSGAFSGSETSITETASNSAANSGGQLFSGLIGTLITTGIAYTTLDWLRTKNNDFSPVRGMFSVFSREYFVPVLVLYILQAIFTFLWTLLFVIPGLIKSYSYSQTYYIYKDVNQKGEANNLNYLDYITLSRELMNGHKFEMFVLQLSFIGWWLLVFLTFGIAAIWVYPYYQTTMSAYYKNLAGDKFINYRG